MKPLVYWCRWHNARLRLHGRDKTAVWGELAFPNHSEPFRFNLQSWQLQRGEGAAVQEIQLDEMGIEIKPED